MTPIPRYGLWDTDTMTNWLIDSMNELMKIPWVNGHQMNYQMNELLIYACMNNEWRNFSEFVQYLE